jgi:hypothetical protein
MVAEQEEEYITNKLTRKIQELAREKTELLLKVEAEEEMITNTLQRKLNKVNHMPKLRLQLQKEKIEMENALEMEQEFIVNRLQKQFKTPSYDFIFD